LSPKRELLPRDRLEELLAEGVKLAREREQNTFDEAARPCSRRIVIYGAGGLGKRVLAGLRANGLEPVGFADRNPASWTRTEGGLPILPPQEAARRYGRDAVFVVSVWHPVRKGGLHAIASDLGAMGCTRVVPFVWLFWKFPQTFLPYYLWDLPSRLAANAAPLRQALACFDGPRSQEEFVRQVELRLTADCRILPALHDEPQYFPKQLFRHRDDECFVDCGAYDGDTLLEFAEWSGGCFRKVIAFEADPVNFAALQRATAVDQDLQSRVLALQAAVGKERAKLRFAATGLGNAAICESGAVEVECVPLDEALASEVPTYIKMDIEGAEPDALAGAATTIRDHKPVLAVCAYHAQDHLWRIPLLLRQSEPEARLFLRPYRLDGLDLVCYALPDGRIVDHSAEKIGC